MRKFVARALAIPGIRHVGGPMTPGPSSSAGPGKEYHDQVMKERAMAKAEKMENIASPEIYNVPTVTMTPVHRTAAARELWKALLLLTGESRGGLIVTGVDGMGKSSLVSDFCDSLRNTHKYSCIQWFNGRLSLRHQLNSYIMEMKERKESNVLLVFDDIRNVKELEQLVAKQPGIHFIATANPSALTQKHGFTEFSVPSLSRTEAIEIVRRFVDDDEICGKVVETVGEVPLLLGLSAQLIDSGVTSVDLFKRIEELAPRVDGAVSVLSTTKALLQVVAEQLSSFENAKETLGELAFLQINDIRPSLVPHPEVGMFLEKCCSLGILSVRWEEESYTMHPVVAKALRELYPDCAAKAVENVANAWPRRLRGKQNSLVQSLVMHVVCLSTAFEEAGIPATDALNKLKERAATFLVYGEFRDLGVAADLWYGALMARNAAGDRTQETLTLAVEVGKIFSIGKDPRAAEVLRAALELAAEIHGKSSAEHAIRLASYAAFIEPSEMPMEDIDVGVSALLNAVRGGSREPLSTDEVRQYKQATFVLLVSKAKGLESRGQEVSEDLWRDMDSIKEELRK